MAVGLYRLMMQTQVSRINIKCLVDQVEHSKSVDEPPYFWGILSYLLRFSVVRMVVGPVPTSLFILEVFIYE